MQGKLVHVEFPAEDTTRAKDFWTGLAGWQFQSWDGPIEYNMFEGEPGGAIYPRQAGETGPIIYFGTDDIDGTVQQIRGLGGSAEDKQPIPGVGWYARCKDTEGNPFSLYQEDASATIPMG